MAADACLVATNTLIVVMLKIRAVVAGAVGPGQDRPQRGRLQYVVRSCSRGRWPRKNTDLSERPATAINDRLARLFYREEPRI